jgi:hypothetical protein
MEIELDTKPAGRHAYAARMDAERRNTNNKSLYTAEQIKRAVTVHDLMHTAYSHSLLEINYRKTFIAVKAEGARARDTMAKTLMELFQSRGYRVVRSPQSLIIRLYN